MQQKPRFLVPKRSSHRVDQLCLLPRHGSSEITKGSVVPFFFFSLSPLLQARLSVISFCFFFLFISFLAFLFLFLISFLFFFSFPFSLLLFLFFIFFSHRIVWFASSERKLPLTLLFILPCVTFSMVHVSHGHMYYEHML